VAALASARYGLLGEQVCAITPAGVVSSLPHAAKAPTASSATIARAARCAPDMERSLIELLARHCRKPPRRGASGLPVATPVA
jgi:hypothetical protein